MISRRLVSKEDAKEVSVEHVDPKKIYAVIEPGLPDPVLIRLDEDAGKIYCANLSACPWTAHTRDSNPTDDTPQEAIARFINLLLREKDRKVHEFNTLFDFCSWLIDLKQGRVDVTAPAEEEEVVELKREESAKPLGKKTYTKIQHPERLDWAVHYANKQGYPICGSILAWPSSWRRVEKTVTCQKCVRAYNQRSTAFYNIDIKRSRG